MAQGVIVKGIGGFYFVQSEGVEYSCSLRGKLRKREDGVLVGDRVEFTALGQDQGVLKGVVEEILPRQNELLRPRIANVDQGLIILAATDPDPDWMLLDRLLVLMQFAKVTPAICLNKIDLLSPGHPVWAQLEVYRQAGFSVLQASALAQTGTTAIQAWLKGQISVVAGPSGAGKSSTLNLVQPGLHLETGSISDKLGRGKHTTRRVELLPLEFGGWVADSPGFSRLDLPTQLETAQLPTLYPEFTGPERQCKYDGCCHHKEPDCGVKAALAAGQIDQDRYERYLQLLAELQQRTSY